MTKITRLLAIFLFIIPSSALFAEIPFNQNLSDAEKAKLQNGELVIRKSKSLKNLCVDSESQGVLSLAYNELSDIKSGYLAEVLQAFPVKGNEDIVKKISSVLGDIHSYKGIPYYSERNKTWVELYSQADILSETECTSDVFGTGRDIRADFFMEPFGSINSTVNLFNDEASLFFASTNLNTIKYKTLRCIKPGKLKSVVLVIKDTDSPQEQWIIYGAGGASAPRLPGFERRMEVSFINRVKAFCAFVLEKIK